MYIIKYGFVVLHYMADEMTIQCVDNLIKTFPETDMKVIVVDNGSTNESGKVLKEYYSNVSAVDVILNKENLGFARGNNLGYQYVKEKYNPQFIIVMNNDVFIKQKEFLKLISEIYNRTAFGVLGPDIYCTYTKRHQNPSRMKGLTKEQVKREIQFREAREKNFAFHYYKHLTVGKLKRILLGDKTPYVDYEHEAVGVVLHGACYIFSSDFMARRDYAFNPNTFLYFEEDILHKECEIEGITMLYSPALKIEHLEDISTNTVFNSEYKKAKMKNCEMLKSARVLDNIFS